MLIVNNIIRKVVASRVLCLYYARPECIEVPLNLRKGIMQDLNALIANISAFKSRIIPFLKFKFKVQAIVNFDFFSEASVIWSAPTIKLK